MLLLLGPQGVRGEHQVHRHHHHFIIGAMASTSIDSHATKQELYAISKDVLTHKRCTPTFPKYPQLVPSHLTHFKPALVLLAQRLPAQSPFRCSSLNDVMPATLRSPQASHGGTPSVERKLYRYVISVF
jgi:hypothetical protein